MHAARSLARPIYAQLMQVASASSPALVPRSNLNRAQKVINRLAVDSSKNSQLEKLTGLETERESETKNPKLMIDTQYLKERLFTIEALVGISRAGWMDGWMEGFCKAESRLLQQIIPSLFLLSAAAAARTTPFVRQ